MVVLILQMCEFRKLQRLLTARRYSAKAIDDKSTEISISALQYYILGDEISRREAVPGGHSLQKA